LKAHIGKYNFTLEKLFLIKKFYVAALGTTADLRISQSRTFVK
jgi:hypothetical protein